MAPRIGLALSGGGSKGAFTVGALQILKTEFEVDFFPIVAGTSTGSLIGTMLASNQFGRLVKIYTGVTTDDIVNPHHALVADLFGDEAVLFSQALFGGRAIYDSQALARVIEDNIDYPAIQGSPTDLFYTVLDLQTGACEVVAAKGLAEAELIQAVLASASMPVLVDPVEVEVDGATHQYVDGGVREFLPLTAVYGHAPPDLEVIVALSTAPEAPRAKKKPFDEIMQILVRTIDLYDTEIARNDYRGALRLNALLKLRDVALGAGLTQKAIKDAVGTEIWNEMDGKKSIPVEFVGPLTHFDFNSLHFDPDLMKAALQSGQKAALRALPRIHKALEASAVPPIV